MDVLEIGEPWGPVGDLLEVIDGDFNVRGAGHGEQVQDSISRATESVHDNDRVQEGVRGGLGASVLGPQNVVIDLQNADLLAPPSTDAGTVYVTQLPDAVAFQSN